jgi:hypothetical protein
MYRASQMSSERKFKNLLFVFVFFVGLFSLSIFGIDAGKKIKEPEPVQMEQQVQPKKLDLLNADVKHFEAPMPLILTINFTTN